MRIGMLADLYRPHISGVTNHIDLVRQALEARGHEVYVFTFGEPHPEDDERVVRSPGFSLRVRAQSITFNFRHTPAARRLLIQMDVLHTHHPFLSGQLALRYGKPWGIPVVFTNHTRYDLYMRAYLPLLPPTLGDTLLRTYLPRFCREVDAVVAPSPGVKAMLERLDVDAPIHVIPNGIDLTRFQNVTPHDRRAWGFQEDHVVFVYLGRMAPEKNLGLLLRAFAAVAQVHPNARFLFIGDGPERKNLEAQVEAFRLDDRVLFAGLVPYEQVPGYLSACDVFATASLTEVHPLSVIEAHAAGLPVVAIRAPGVEDVVRHEHSGFLVENDAAALSAAMSRLVSEPDLRKRMAGNAREVAKEFDIHRTASLLEDLYTSLQAKRAAFRPSLGLRLRRWLMLWGRDASAVQ